VKEEMNSVRQPPRIGKITLCSAVFCVIGGILALFLLHSDREVRVRIAVMNQGKEVGFLNLGESRWFGAAFEIFPAGDHARTVASGNAGSTVVVPPGNYDIEVSYSNGEYVKLKELQGIVIHHDFRTAVELDLPPDEFRPPLTGNPWRP
jgi:hypothetical protein